MNKQTIGAFIAQCRREKHLTQERLAEMLNVSDKSVSKWENGHCLPDVSLYEQLCGILEISVNELFAGKRIREESYREIADRNLLDMLKWKLYRCGDQRISFSEFDNALTRIAELTAELRRFSSRAEAVDYMVAESGCSREECAAAYDFYVKLFTVGEDFR